MRNLMLKTAAWQQSRTPREEGQTVVEYALVIGLVSVVIALAFATVAGGWVTTIGSKVGIHINSI